jgi:hypothetical protein
MKVPWLPFSALLADLRYLSVPVLNRYLGRVKAEKQKTMQNRPLARKVKHGLQFFWSADIQLWRSQRNIFPALSIPLLTIISIDFVNTLAVQGCQEFFTDRRAQISTGLHKKPHLL